MRWPCWQCKSVRLGIHFAERKFDQPDERWNHKVPLHSFLKVSVYNSQLKTQWRRTSFLVYLFVCQLLRVNHVMPCFRGNGIISFHANHPHQFDSRTHFRRNTIKQSYLRSNWERWTWTMNHMAKSMINSYTHCYAPNEEIIGKTVSGAKVPNDKQKKEKFKSTEFRTDSRWLFYGEVVQCARLLSIVSHSVPSCYLRASALNWRFSRCSPASTRWWLAGWLVDLKCV